MPAVLEPVQLEDIVVTGRPLDVLIDNFVNEVAEPNDRRGLARLSDPICVKIVNLDGELDPSIAARISQVATEVGARVGGANCVPNVVVVATSDGTDVAGRLVESRKRAFRSGATGMNRGAAALRDFVDTPRPVRWWQISMPFDTMTGQRAVRIPGECSGDCSRNTDFAPGIHKPASRIRTTIADALLHTLVIVDVDDARKLTRDQLADYIAMISLAQINPDATTVTYSSILNVFDASDDVMALTAWDHAYLSGLYNAERNQLGLNAGRNEIVNSIHRVHRQLRADAAEPGQTDGIAPD